ncbi:MAG: ADP-ribosylglycohydrolase family protein [Gammaproteobacteria bacterium]|nr:ADP-ribosylglycohydrolase family protein [Gammaproteobacteria bacterium]MDH5652013.1 ADP-ribosylglycohydrolase family protein [Gammaproteobacteria bacterium]
MNKLLLDKAKGMLVGLAAGDAVGTTVEFKMRGSFPPVTDMTGGGPFNLAKGKWTDDTSMALCLADSLLACSGFDATDQMQRYCRWYKEGYMSSTGRCFDIGGTTADALNRFSVTGDPFAGSTDPRSAGNGSVMRLAPVAITYQHDRDALLQFAADSSRTTHGCDEAVESCRLFAVQLALAMQGKDKTTILTGHGYNSPAEKVERIGRGEYLDKGYNQLSGSGYVINTLETALWCFAHTNNFRDAILMTVNVGDDADTTAAVCGQIAGAFYGYEGIPAEWRAALYMEKEITEQAGKLLEIANIKECEDVD